MPLVPVRSAPTAAPVLPEWRELTLIFRQPSGAIHSEDGVAYGTLAVHASLDADAAPVTVTHLPTKLAIVRVTEVNDAIAAAEQLWAACTPAWSRRGEDVDREKIPADVVQWIRDCNHARKLLPRG